MPTYTEITDSLTTKVLDAAKPAESLTLTVASVVDKTTAKLTGRLPALPFADRLPSAGEVVTANLAAAQRLLQAQAAFAAQLIPAQVEVVEPVAAAKPAKTAK